jgi:hypothetical protein
MPHRVIWCEGLLADLASAAEGDPALDEEKFVKTTRMIWWDTIGARCIVIWALICTSDIMSCVQMISATPLR